jgi:Ca-activated chloride channel family protein
MLDTLQQLYWREPLWLLLALQPLALVLLRSLWRQQRLSRYADTPLQPWVITRQPLGKQLAPRNLAYLLAWLLFAVAMAGPRLPLEIPGQQLAAGGDVMIVLDLSRSMHVQDTLPTRLKRARLELHELLQRAQRDRIGMIVYAARPHVYVPLTNDHSALRTYLENLDTLALPTEGSLPIPALQRAQQELANTRQAANIVWITDGDLSGIDSPALQQVVTNLRQHNVTLSILGVGSVEGEAIPLEDGSWLTQDARPVISRMQETRLRHLAEMGGGQYSPVQDDDRDWQTLYDTGIARQASRDATVEATQQVIWQELYPLALLPAMLLWLLSAYPFRLRLSRFTRPAAVTASVLVLSFISIKPAGADNAEQQAYRAWQQANYKNAVDLYEALPGYAGRIGEGASRYRQADYPGAIRQFSQAMLLAESDPERSRALYNLANSYFMTGDYDQAINVYQDVLRYDADHRQARTNLAFSQALKKTIEQRLGRSGRSKRMGRGPRSARAEQEIDLNEIGSVSIDESEDDNASKDGSGCRGS